MSFLAELRRRNVVRVGAGYAVVSWIVLQVADLAAPALRLPEWVTSLVLFLLLLGLPVALFLAWAYELTPEGIRRTQEVGDAARVDRGSKFDIAVILLLVVAIGLILQDSYFSRPEVEVESHEALREQTPVPEPNPEPVSIAVIPFLNMSDDPAQEHFADGLTEELLNSLAPIDELRVISRTSSFAFKDSDLPLPEIAERLGVSNILEGSVRRAGDRVRITAQLIETTTDSHLWSETYDRELTVDSIFEIQESIAGTVVDALKIRLLVPRADPELPSNIEALDLYHDGLFVLRQIETGQRWGDAEFREAEAKLTAAMNADPDWVTPAAALGRLYHFWSGGGQDREKLAKSRRLIEEVLARDPDNPAALASLGYILSVEGRFLESLAMYGKAEEAGGVAQWGRAITLMSMGRIDEAVNAYRRALASDPLNSAVRRQLIRALQCAGRHDEVLANETELLAQFGTETPMLHLLAKSHARLGNREAALGYVDGLPADSEQKAFFADVFAMLGEDERAHRAIDELAARNAGLETAALAARVLGDDDSALSLLERADEQAPVGLTSWLFCEPEIRGLAGNLRYDAVLKRRGLLPEQRQSGE